MSDVAVLTRIGLLATRPAGSAGLVAALVVGPFVARSPTVPASLAAAAWTVGQVVLAFALTAVAHEAGHYLAVPATTRRATAGRWRVEGSWTRVSVTGPADAVGSLAVLAGPLAGVGAALALWVAGVTAWACLPLAVVHLANLTTWCPDGRLLVTIGAHRSEAPR